MRDIASRLGCERSAAEVRVTGSSLAPKEPQCSTSSRLAVRPPFSVRPAGLATLGARLLALALASATASAAAQCTPPGQLRSANVARAERPDGTSEVTEYAPGGGYRVTRCGADGGVLVSQTVSPIADPDGGDGARPDRGAAARRHASRRSTATRRRPAGRRPSAPTATRCARGHRADRAAAGAAGRRCRATARRARCAASRCRRPAHVRPPAVRTVASDRARRAVGGQIARAAVAGDACTNTQYASVERRRGRAARYGYRVNRSRFNYNDTSVASIVDGHRNWDTTYNSCGLNDITNLTSQYLGSTSVTIHTYPDGTSVTDKGDLASVGCAGALACTWLFTNGGGPRPRPTSATTRTSRSRTSAPRAPTTTSRSATHESGHSIGLDHAELERRADDVLRRSAPARRTRARSPRATCWACARATRERLQPMANGPARILRPRSISSPSASALAYPPIAARNAGGAHLRGGVP